MYTFCWASSKTEEGFKQSKPRQTGECERIGVVIHKVASIHRRVVMLLFCNEGIDGSGGWKWLMISVSQI